MLVDGDGAWLKKVDSDGLIHGSMNPMGTPHSRASHYSPNLAQVPKVQKLYGKECRSLFGGHHKSGPGWVQVGADMSGLQQRALGHYLAPIDGGAYGEMVVSEDIHWVYAQARRSCRRDEARQEEPAARHHPRHRLASHSATRTCSGASLRSRSGHAQLLHHRAAEGLPGALRTVLRQGREQRQGRRGVRKVFDEKLKLGALNKRSCITSPPWEVEGAHHEASTVARCRAARSTRCSTTCSRAPKPSSARRGSCSRLRRTDQAWLSLGLGWRLRAHALGSRRDTGGPSEKDWKKEVGNISSPAQSAQVKSSASGSRSPASLRWEEIGPRVIDLFWRRVIKRALQRAGGGRDGRIGTGTAVYTPRVGRSTQHTGYRGKSIKDQSQTVCWSVIPATIQSALTPITYS
jgi:hypothetical protein